MKKKSARSKINNSRKKTNKKHHIFLRSLIAIGGLAVIISTFLITNYLINYYRENSYVATVDNQQISVKQFAQRLDLDRSGIFSYFKTKYNIDDNSKFWTSNYHGEIPLEKLKQQALNELKTIMVQEILAKKEGLKNDISYTQFLKDLKSINDSRNEAIKEGKIIYGPINYDENTYFEDTFAKLVIKLKEKLVGDGIIKFSEEDLKKYYETIKNTFYIENQSVKIEKIFIPYLDSNSKLGVVKKKEALTKIEEIKSKILKGASFEELAKLYNPNVDSKNSYGEQEYSDETEKYDTADDEKVKTEAFKLRKGQVLDKIIEANNSYILMKCIETIPKSYKTYDEIKDNVKLKYTDTKYDAMIKKLVASSKLVINNKIYNWVKVN